MFKRNSFLILVFVLLTRMMDGAVVNSPNPTCVSVSATGSVTLSWSTPSDPSSSFNSYLIYSSSSHNGPYVLSFSSSNYSLTNFTDISVNANAAPVYYYIQTSYNNGGLVTSPAIDTVCSMHLNVINPGNGTAVLSWNAIHTPLLPTSSGLYTVYQEFPTGVWSLIGSTTSLNYIDTIYVCNAYLNYKIEMDDNTGCTSISSIAGGTFQNLIVPSTPVFDTLSVNDNNQAMMNWNVNPSPDAEAYIIYIQSGSGWIAVDTVYGINSISYTYLLSNAGLSSEQYNIAAFDSCGRRSPMGNPLSTIFLSASANICDRSTTLHWTGYSNLGNGLAGYRIFQSTTGMAGPYTLAATVNSTTLTYTVANLAPSTMYYFKIQAYDSTGTKTVSSNRIKFYSATPIPPTFSYLRYASVTAPDKITVSCHIDVAASVLGYKIYRSVDTAAADYKHVGTVATSLTTPIIYNDLQVKTNERSYYYKMVVVDSCGYDGFETNIGKTIFLRAISNEDMTNTLSWNDYETWSGNVATYNIYRGIDGAMDPTPIANVSSSFTGTNTYIDDVSMLFSGQGVFNYYVQAIEGTGNVFGFVDSSLSNIADAYQDPMVYIPNSFKPNGINTIFKPITTYVDLAEYEFSVYNRWGMKVFSSKDVTQGWDGSEGGKIGEGGVFVYVVQYKNSKGEYIQRKGSVTLLR